MRKIQCETCTVRRPGMICDLPAQALEEFRATGTSVVYKQRQVVFSEGGPANGLYQLCFGAVKLSFSDSRGWRSTPESRILLDFGTK